MAYRADKSPVGHRCVRAREANLGVHEHVLPPALVNRKVHRAGELRLRFDDVLDEVVVPVALEAVAPLTQRARVVYSQHQRSSSIKQNECIR